MCIVRSWICGCPLLIITLLYITVYYWAIYIMITFRFFKRKLQIFGEICYLKFKNVPVFGCSPLFPAGTTQKDFTVDFWGFYRGILYNYGVKYLAWFFRLILSIQRFSMVEIPNITYSTRYKIKYKFSGSIY